LKGLSLAVLAQHPLEHLKNADALNTSIQSEESTTTREGITGDHLKGLAGAEAEVFAHRAGQAREFTDGLAIKR
jgi:hypothetical protein